MFVAFDAVRQPENVLFAVAKAVQVREEDARNTRDSLIRFFASRQYLLILDNFEHVSDAAGIVSELLTATSRLKLLVTSRSRLQIRPEHHFELPPLPSAGPNLHEAAGVALFLDRAPYCQVNRTDRPEDALATIAEICERLDGLPLAIELAAARTRLLSPKQLLVRLGNRLPMLSGRAPRCSGEAADETRSLGVTNCSTLTQRRLLRQLSVFHGGIAISAVEAIPDDSDDNASVLGFANEIGRA